MLVSTLTVNVAEHVPNSTEKGKAGNPVHSPSWTILFLIFQ
jgi:hypothetical protein